MRVFLASSMAGLTAAMAAGEVRAESGHAVTPTLREWYTEGDAEELEYVASSAAAKASLRLLAHLEPASAYRRVVLAVDVPAASVHPMPEAGRSVVRLTEAVPWRLVASALVDDAAAADDVRRGVDAVRSATGDGVRDALEAVEDHELGWYAVQELAALVRP